MSSDKTKRTRLVAEIAELRKQQLEAVNAAIFRCLTSEQSAAHDLRAERLALLVFELELLDGL